LFTNQSYDQAFQFIGALIGVGLIGGLTENLKNIIGGRIILSLSKQTRLEYLSALQDMDYEYHTNKSSGSLISIAKRGDSALDAALFGINDEAFAIIIEFIIAALVITRINQLISILTVGMLLISLLISYFILKVNLKQRELANKSEDNLTALLVDNFVAFETVKIFAKEKWEKLRLLKEFIPWTKAQSKYLNSFRLIDITILLTTTIGLAIVFIYSGFLVKSKTITIGEFAVITTFLLAIVQSLYRVVYKLRDLAKTYADLVRYFEIMDLKPLLKDAVSPIKIENPKGEISLNEIGFRYTNNESILKGINLLIKPAETVALVGKSGAGKTTLTKLLLRLYDPTEGTIRIDGVDLKSISQFDLRNLIGVVPQEPILFNDSIGYNIAYAKDNPTQVEIEYAARKANLFEFISKLPKGFGTIVGERGIKLSGGQKQRLAIARIILKNPAIVIFDEATSQLDSENEREVHAAFTNLRKSKTTIIIAHRLSTIMDADRIVVFEAGQIIEIGSHAELMSKTGIYNKLWKLQTAGLIN